MGRSLLLLQPMNWLTLRRFAAARRSATLNKTQTEKSEG